MPNSSSNIKLIISGCIAGNEKFERKLFDLNYSFVYSICNRYAKSEEDRMEMINDTFYTVFRYLDRYDSSYEFKPWLRKLCVNCCLQHLKKSKNDFHFLELDANVSEEFHEESIKNVDESVYLELLKNLPPAYRTVFNLYVFEEYKHHEIADLLHISVNTSKSNYSRAKVKLIEQINAYNNKQFKNAQHG